MATTAPSRPVDSLRTLPGDDVRHIMWRFSDRLDLQMVVQSVRAVARGPVARLVAAGGRSSHDWTSGKAELLPQYDASGISSAFIDTQYGGYIEGPKNFALSLIGFELAWVDAGAATCSLATCLGLAPVMAKGTSEQKEYYLSHCVPGAYEKTYRGAFALTEPIPFVGVETGLLSGRVKVVEWEEGKDPILEVDKRGRFITNMGFANMVTAAVDSGDERIKGSCMIILEETDPGTFDRGTPTRKLVHQLSSTSDPIFRLQVPANRIVGGYTVKDGVIIPNFSHGEVIEAVFRHTRVGVGLMTAAKLLSAIEPLIRYQRDRFRGSGTVPPGSPRYELGIQQKQDALHRLLDIWATGEASASLGFLASRIIDELDPLEEEKNRLLAEQGAEGGRAMLRVMRKVEQEAILYLKGEAQETPLIKYALLDSVTNVFCPAVKLWNTGQGSAMMRQAVSLMGGYGITEDCPGFLGYKWMDTQLEATYEGPEAVQRRQLSVTMVNDLFLAQFKSWIPEMKQVASKRPGTGACALATAMQMWLWTVRYLQKAKDADGQALYQSSRHGVTFPLADALCWLLAARSFILDVLELEEKGPENPVVAEGIEGTVRFFSDLCHVQTAHASGEVGRICAELLNGYNRHPAWDDPNYQGCFHESELILIESMVPGMSSMDFDVIGDDGSHAAKAGPCAKPAGLEGFTRLRTKLDSCLTGSMLAKDRAADALTKVMIPAALDYPV